MTEPTPTTDANDGSTPNLGYGVTWPSLDTFTELARTRRVDHRVQREGGQREERVGSDQRCAVLALLGHHHPVDDGLRAHDPADAESRADRFREGAYIDYRPGLVILLQRRRRATVQVQGSVDVVLEHRHAMTSRHQHEMRSPLQRHQRARRVLKPRLDDDQPDATLRKQGLELIDAHAVPVCRDADEAGPCQRERLEDPEVGRRLDLDFVSRLDQGAGRKRKALRRT